MQRVRDVLVLCPVLRLPGAGERLAKGSPLALAETPSLKSVDVNSWYGMFAPAGTPDSVMSTLTSALRDTLKDSVLIDKMNTAGLQPLNIERAAFTTLLQRERDELAAAVKAAGIKPE